MRVLQICSKPPLPEIDGGCKATNSITQGLLKNNIEVKVLTMSTHKHPFQQKEFQKDDTLNVDVAHLFIDTRVTFFGAFFNLFTSKSYHVTRFISKKFEELIIQTITQNSFDVVLLEGLYTTSYIDAIRSISNSKIIYRSHNVECKIWERNSVSASIWLKRIYFNLLTKRLKRYESSILNKVDAIAAISENDKMELIQLGAQKEVEVFPFGVDIEKYKAESSTNNLNFFHIGSMDWIPNQEGIKWFLEQVWDNVVKKNTKTQLNLAGKDMPKWMLNWEQKNVSILGQVSDAIQFMKRNDVMIVPLFSGSGMRIKIIEAMALGKAVIATSIAAEGINYTTDEDIIIANSVSEYVAAIDKVLIG